MKAHGGSAKVDTGPNGGAVFTLVFPPALAHVPPVAGRD
jgi:signal transduction histidine kinase